MRALAQVEQSVNASPENAVRCFMTGAQPFFSVNLCALGVRAARTARALKLA